MVKFSQVWDTVQEGTVNRKREFLKLYLKIYIPRFEILTRFFQFPLKINFNTKITKFADKIDCPNIDLMIITEAKQSSPGLKSCK